MLRTTPSSVSDNLRASTLCIAQARQAAERTGEGGNQTGSRGSVCASSMSPARRSTPWGRSTPWAGTRVRMLFLVRALWCGPRRKSGCRTLPTTRRIRPRGRKRNTPKAIRPAPWEAPGRNRRTSPVHEPPVSTLREQKWFKSRCPSVIPPLARGTRLSQIPVKAQRKPCRERAG